MKWLLTFCTKYPKGKGAINKTENKSQKPENPNNTKSRTTESKYVSDTARLVGTNVFKSAARRPKKKKATHSGR